MAGTSFTDRPRCRLASSREPMLTLGPHPFDLRREHGAFIDGWHEGAEVDRSPHIEVVCSQAGTAMVVRASMRVRRLMAGMFRLRAKTVQPVTEMRQHWIMRAWTPEGLAILSVRLPPELESAQLLRAARLCALLAGRILEGRV